MTEAKSKAVPAGSVPDEQPDFSSLPPERILEFDPDDWTIGDLEDFEEQTGGLTLSEVLTPAERHDSAGQVMKDERGRPVRSIKMPAKTLKAIVWVERRRTDSDYTLEDARTSKVVAIVLKDSEPDPKDDKPATTESSSSPDSSGSTTSRSRKSASSKRANTT